MDDRPDGDFLRELVAEALREAARALDGRRQRQARSSLPPATRRGPTNPLHRTWRGFVLDMQQLEALARRKNLKLTKGNVCRLGVDTVKTVTSTMRWYGLADTAWPPSTWDPDEPRKGGEIGG